MKKQKIDDEVKTFTEKILSGFYVDKFEIYCAVMRIQEAGYLSGFADGVREAADEKE